MHSSNDTLSARDRAILGMTPADAERFRALIDKTPGQGPKGKCREWKGRRDKNGYGIFTVDRKTILAHRVAFFLANGHLPPPDAPCVLHSCDNPPCCNPKCLWAGTNADNMADRDAKGRQASGDRNGARTRPERLARGERNGARLHPERLARGNRNGSRMHPESRPRGDANGARLYPERLAHGDRNGRAKLAGTDIPAIRAIAATGVSMSALGRRYGVHRTTIQRAIAGESWSHV